MIESRLRSKVRSQGFGRVLATVRGGMMHLPPPPHGNGKNLHFLHRPVFTTQPKFSLWLKSMLPLLGQTVRSYHGQCKECLKVGATGPLGHTDLIMRRARVVFHPSEERGFCSS